MDEKTDVVDELNAFLNRRDFAAAVSHVERGLVVLDKEFGGGASLIGSLVDMGATDAVRRLIALGSNVNQKTQYGSLLVSACQGGHTEMAEALLDAGADVKRTNHGMEDSGITALVAATWRCSVALVKRLLEAGADPKAVTKRGETAMSGAISRAMKPAMSLARFGEPADVEMMNLLWSAGCPVGATDLHSPVVRRNWKIVELLLKWHADANGIWRAPLPPNGVEKGDMPIHLAAGESPVDLPVLRRPPRFASERAIEHLAPRIRQDRLTILKALLKAGADVNAVQPSSGHTPLTLAIVQKDLEVADLLLEAGADPKTEVKVRKKRGSPRQFAEATGKAEFVELIARHGG
jgi:ankyrin repeat protein